jgi:hypothetical protein
VRRASCVVRRAETQRSQSRSTFQALTRETTRNIMRSPQDLSRVSRVLQLPLLSQLITLISDRFLTSCRGDSVAWSGGPVQFAEGFAESAEEIFQLAGEGEELESFVDALVESCRA